MTERLGFLLPAELEASEPPEARGLARDSVRMLVADRRSGHLLHSQFTELPSLLRPGDLLVINTSATIPAALRGVDPLTGATVAVHLSSDLGGGRWVVELRTLDDEGSSRRWPPGRRHPPIVALDDGAEAVLTGPYRGSDRLCVADLRVPEPLPSWLALRGRPISYGYLDRPVPLAAYQNVYADEPGSAEMPSAGRPFTPELLTRLVAVGVGVTPVVLHTGVASLEAEELPYPERLRVPPWSAARVNLTRASGGRVVAVGTTVVRALESAWHQASGEVRPIDGWTDLVVTPERGVAAVDGLLTGWHEPEASHLLMLEAVAGRPLLDASYRAALEGGYRWHEFGDMHLILC